MARVAELGRGRLLLDLGFRGTEGLIASYAFPAPEGWALVETGPTTCRAALLAGLDEAGIDPREVRHVLVTHIHLDHAGGLGALAQALPNARLYAHRAGVAHLVDPSRLTASARRTWGPESDRLWGPIVPTPAERLVALDGGERIPLREGELRVIPTPGHARNHLAFSDSGLRAVLTGDAAGVRLSGDDRARPAVPPPELDLSELFESLDRIKAAEPERLLYTHFGPGPAGGGELDEYRRSVERWRDEALRVARERPEVPAMAEALRALDRRERGPAAEPSNRRGELVSGYEIAAQGLLRYFRTRGEIPPEGN